MSIVFWVFYLYLYISDAKEKGYITFKSISLSLTFKQTFQLRNIAA